MADQREAILSRLVAVCAAVEGIRSVSRNRLDVPELERPSAIILDGSEEFSDAPRVGIDVISRINLQPQIQLMVRGSDGVNPGSLMTLYRNRILAAVMNDASLATSVGTTGGIRYQGCAASAPDPETKEFQINLDLVFTYRFQTSDLV